jgi:hypothetical protein
MRRSLMCKVFNTWTDIAEEVIGPAIEEKFLNRDGTLQDDVKIVQIAKKGYALEKGNIKLIAYYDGYMCAIVN